MQSSALVFLVLVLGAVNSYSSSKPSPITQVVQLLAELEARVTSDGKKEQSSYDKYACWCEDTLARKAADIGAEKALIGELGQLIIKLKEEISAHAAEIVQLKKDIAANIEAQREATEVREKENAEYTAERTESEQCIGALEAAIKVLSGAGTGKKGFLETLQEAQVLSVVDGVRGLLKKSVVSHAVSESDLKAVQRFVDRPEDFLGARSNFLSASQIANNPFGDYAPQSTQIQGILKGMYDAFTADLEKDNADEASSQKAFEELMTTKKKELETLQLTLDKQTLDEAQKTAKLAESKQTLDDTQVQLDADEKFFAETKEDCKTKASEWAERSRLRTEELQSIKKAIAILSSPEAQKTFSNSSATFLQLAAVSQHTASNPNKAYNRLKSLAVKYRSTSLAQLAVQAKAGGHFDKVMASIDAMIEFLRKEEQADIEHRDRCQGSQFKNKNDKEDLQSTIDKTDKEISRMKDEAKELKTKIATLKGDIEISKSNMEALLKMRNKEHAEFVQHLKEDVDAIALIEQAMVSLADFYKRNQIPLELAQEPQYTIDQDKAPETIWEGADYGGRKSESTGIIAILEMCKEDIQKEIQEGRQWDADAQERYQFVRADLKDILDSQIASKIALEKQLAELEGTAVDTEEFKSSKEGDLDAEKKLSDALYSDCSWVETHFKSRREKRKAEIAGLQEAKDYLAGVESGEELAP